MSARGSQILLLADRTFVDFFSIEKRIASTCIMHFWKRLIRVIPPYPYRKSGSWKPTENRKSEKRQRQFSDRYTAHQDWKQWVVTEDTAAEEEEIRVEAEEEEEVIVEGK